jgi:hypothetical protein
MRVAGWFKSIDLKASYVYQQILVNLQHSEAHDIEHRHASDGLTSPDRKISNGVHGGMDAVRSMFCNRA